jgi:hypothetical protein
MLTYLVNWDYHVPDIAGRFSLSVRSILDANGFSEEKPVKFFSFFFSYLCYRPVFTGIRQGSSFYAGSSCLLALNDLVTFGQLEQITANMR